MWADNETTKDLLNYEVHCNLLKEYLTHKELLPLTIGVFGDWGSGKSSIMRMLEEKFKSEEKVLTIYFNSWLFESYEDAKISLLENILLELSKGQTLTQEAKNKILHLLSRVDYMKLASDGVKKYGKNIVDFFTTGGALTAIEATYSMLNKDLTESNLTPELITQYIKEEQENKSKTTIKSFKEDFSKLIELTEYDSVVIFIDDLDRCLPERVINTLEAIKLFLSVDNTAFVIGADERILKHSISMHLQLHTFNNNSSFINATEQIVTDYIEKLIQIPYRIPKLSPSEVESYNNLLFCKNKLNKNDFNLVYNDYSNFKKDNFYTSYSLGHIKRIINLDDKNELDMLLNISHQASFMITNVLKGNPRQTKRFLNTFILRQKLAEVANINIENLILIKLMLLEYFNGKLFNKLNDIQSENDGIARELKLLESNLIDGELIEELDNFKEWNNNEQIINWIKLEPRLSEIDLRDYFWLARDKTGSTLSNVHMVSPKIQHIYKGLITDNSSSIRVSLEEAKKLEEPELHELYNLFESNIQAVKDLKIHLTSLHDLTIQINGYTFFVRYLGIYKNISYSRIEKLIFIPDKLFEIKNKEISLLDEVEDVLTKYSNQPKGLLKNASLKILEKGIK
jgi:predicted KAP-like P-loop ATPase